MRVMLNSGKNVGNLVAECLHLLDFGIERLTEGLHLGDCRAELLTEVINRAYYLSMEFKDIVRGGTDGCRFCFFLCGNEGACAIDNILKIERYACGFTQLENEICIRTTIECCTNIA